MRWLVSALCVVIFAVGCSGSKTPTTPSTNTGVTAVPTGPVITVPTTPSGVKTSVALSTATVTVEWNAVSNAKEYVTEIGIAPGSISILHRVSTTSDTFTALGVGKYYVRVKASNEAGTSEPSTDVKAVIIDRSISEYLDALIIGHGKDAPPTQFTYCGWNDSNAQRWAAFPRGTSVRIRAASNIPAKALDLLGRMAQQTAAATDNNITATFEVVTESEPERRPNEIAIARVKDPYALGCAFPGLGCPRNEWSAPGVMKSASIILRDDRTPDNYIHELGHGLFGL